jgi:alpha-1,3/alpha-1,6-mannosyltransferase
MRLVFIHPDLGVGGAERLIIDVAMAAKASGHQITMLTNHYDPKHCFEDTKDLNIIVKASFLPRHLSGKFHAFFAYLKIFLASLWLLFFSNLKYDVIISDQISIPNIVFKLFNFQSKKFKLLFYCHFPDQLLCVYDKKRDFLKRFYRAPLDWMEMVSTGMADGILVNSNFTKNVFRDTFSSLNNKKLQVLYPSLNTEFLDSIIDSTESVFTESLANNQLQNENFKQFQKCFKKKYLFLSINRYERKKNLKLAIDSMLKLKELLTEDLWNSCHLIHAGGFDLRVNENVEHYNELKEYVDELTLNDNVSLLRSVSDVEKGNLLRKSFCLLYTPINEHFGIVPIEAMYCEKPVIATNTGGPLETVSDQVTGYLVEPNAEEFAQKMSNLILNKNLQSKMGSDARNRVINNFSFFAFKEKLNKVLDELVSEK